MWKKRDNSKGKIIEHVEGRGGKPKETKRSRRRKECCFKGNIER